jgi:virulence factor Mce-like protein
MRGLFDYVPGAHRGRPVVWGAVATLVTTAILVIGFTGWTPFPGGAQTVTARFHTALHVYPSTPVRLRGVDVGTVQDATLSPSGDVDLRLRLTTGGITVHRDATATLVWRTLLGRNIYVALDPGTAGAPALGGAVIPPSQTASQVELDQVIGSLQPLARSGMRRFFGEFDQGLTGAAPRQAIGLAGPALVPTAAAITAFRGQNPGTDIPNIVRGGQRSVAALDSNEAALARLIDSADVALGVTAARRADVGSIVSQAPSTLSETRATMARLRRTLDVLDPLATNLLPGVRGVAPAVSAATPTMQDVAAIVPSAVPALRDLAPALRSLRTLGRTGVPLMAELTPTMTRTDTQIVPFLNERSSTTKLRNYEAIGPFFAAVDSSASTLDAGGFMQRFQPGQRAGASTEIPPSACSSLSGSAASSAFTKPCQALVAAINNALIGGVKAP